MYTSELLDENERVTVKCNTNYTWQTSDSVTCIQVTLTKPLSVLYNSILSLLKNLNMLIISVDTLIMHDDKKSVTMKVSIALLKAWIRIFLK